MKKIAALLAATTAMTAAVLTGAPTASAASEEECAYRWSDARLWCGNDAPSGLFVTPHTASGVHGQLKTTYSYFLCWKKGEQHSGGNNTWYYTDADWGASGYIPASRVYTPSWFDAFPKAYGLREC
ncbi:MAG TPA: hypothetical protein VN520_36815 [Streptomyces sp.]|uniref:hypothetical protein n=1 Tax=Streptomyces sp. TaxID=1931 RepID=UPI002CF9A206|nr:hypothetical protein [Streptomyces sp.]HWU11852.1 hypothetical protein [Streptomyces sp.]